MIIATKEYEELRQKALSQVKMRRKLQSVIKNLSERRRNIRRSERSGFEAKARAKGLDQAYAKVLEDLKEIVSE